MIHCFSLCFQGSLCFCLLTVWLLYIEVWISDFIGICWTSWRYRLMFFHQIWDVFGHSFKYFFYPFLSSLGTPIINILAHLMVSHMFLRLFSFFFYSYPSTMGECQWNRLEGDAYWWKFLLSGVVYKLTRLSDGLLEHDASKANRSRKSSHFSFTLLEQSP